MMSRFMKKCDMLNKTFNFKIDEAGTFKTPFGGLITMSLVVATLYVTYYFGKDIYEKKSPLVLKKNHKLNYYPYYTLNSSNFFFALSVEMDNYGIIEDKSSFVYHLKYSYYVRNKTTKKFEKKIKHDIELEKCSEKHKENIEVIKHLNISKYYCAIFSNYTIGGAWDFAPKYGFLSIRVQRCDENTQDKYNLTCLDDIPLLAKYPDKIYIHTITFQNLVNPKSYSKPLEESFETEANFMDLIGYTEQNHFYMISELQTDDGMIFKETSFKKFLQFLRFSTFSYTYNLDNLMYAFNIGVSKVSNYYERTYLKLQEIAARVGGFMNFVAKVLLIIFSIYQNNCYNLFLYENLLKLEIRDEEEKSKKPSSLTEIRQELCILNYTNRDVELKQFKDDSYLKNDPKAQFHRNPHTGVNIDNKNINENRDMNNIRSGILNNNKDSCPRSPEINLQFTQKRPLFYQTDLVLNKDLSKLIEHRSFKRHQISITFCENFNYMYCCFKAKLEKLEKSKSEKNQRYELLAAADQSIKKRLDIVQFLHSQEQLELLKKIILNENQCYMLEHRDLKFILDKGILDEMRTKQLKEQKNQDEVIKLTSYLKDRIKKNNLSKVDLLLFEFLNPDLYNTVQEELKKH